jgi:hypothetical protein
VPKNANENTWALAPATLISGPFAVAAAKAGYSIRTAIGTTEVVPCYKAGCFEFSARAIACLSKIDHHSGQFPKDGRFPTLAAKSKTRRGWGTHFHLSPRAPDSTPSEELCPG